MSVVTAPVGYLMYSSQQPYEVDTTVNPILELRKLRHNIQTCFNVRMRTQITPRVFLGS